MSLHVVRRMAPETVTDLVQVGKAVVAVVVSWLVALRVLELEQAFLAPWAALLTVHATVYRTVWHGALSVAGTVAGVLLAYAAGQLLGLTWVALAVGVGASLLLLRIPHLHLRSHAETAATTALFVITAGYVAQEVLLVQRLLDTLVGVVVGVLVNVLVRPPLDDRIAQRAMDDVVTELGRVLVTIGTDLRADVDETQPLDWMRRTHELDEALESVRGHVGFTRESRWGNPRRHRSPGTVDPDKADDELLAVEDAVAQVRALARVVLTSVVEAQEWDSEFRRRWTDLVRLVGSKTLDRDLDVDDARPAIEQLARDMSHQDLPDEHWPVYGALLTAVLHVAQVLDEVDGGRVEPGRRH